MKKGDVLFEIDSRPFEAAYAEAKSQLEQGKAVQLATQADADRNKELFARKVISEQEFTNKTQQNQANVAKVQALQAAVEEAQLNVQFCQVASPVDGIAGNAMAQVGDLVGQGTNAVLTTVSTVDPIKILFPISEQEYLVAAEKIEQALTKPFEQRDELFEVILANGDTFDKKGRLLSLDRQVNQATGTILITALVENPGGLLRRGSSPRARIKARDLPAAIVVPQRAVSELQGTYQVGVIGADNKAEIRIVKTGPRVGSDWVIASGLKAGEKVVVEGFQKTACRSSRCAPAVDPRRRTQPRNRPHHGSFFHQPSHRCDGHRDHHDHRGIVSYLGLPVAQFPDIVPPEIQVKATYTGADAMTIEQSVATPIEQQMSGVDKMNYMYSVNSNDGSMKLTVNFDVATDPNTDQILSQMRSNQASSQLPSDVNKAGVTVQKSTSAPLIMFSLYSRRAPTTPRSSRTTRTST